VTAPKPLHPNTLAAHLKRKGFARAFREQGHPWTVGGFLVSAADRESGSLVLRYRDPDFWPEGVTYDCRAELMRMADELGPEFEVVADWRNRVVVRRTVKP